MRLELYNCDGAHIQSYDIAHCDQCPSKTDDESKSCHHCVDDPAVDYDDGGCERQETTTDNRCPDCEKHWGTDEN